MSKIPSDKQIELAESIAKKLGIPLPTDFTAQAYWQFTQDNLAKASACPNPPSSRQVDVANVIARTLNIPLPAEFTAKAYWDFTNQNMAASRAARASARAGHHARRHYSHDTQSELGTTARRVREQREADWEATHLSGPCYSTRVLDGDVGAPSWWRGSNESFRTHLRALGCQSSAERDAQLRRNQEFGGVIGDPADW